MKFSFEKKIHKKDGHEYLEITGAEGKVSVLTIPETIDGIRVEAIGNHAFSGREDIKEIVLPRTITTLYGFAFHNCRNLKKISIFDSLDDYYDGVCRQCDSLEEIEITIQRDWYEVIRNFLADNDKTLRFKIYTYSGDKKLTACLTFPGYNYDFNENTMARTIQFTIEGSGYAYRECVDRRKMDYRQYDNLFSKAVIDGSAVAADIAIGRILYPLEIEKRHLEAYEKFLRDNSSFLKRLIDRSDDTPGMEEVIADLLSYEDSRGQGLFTEKDLDDALKYTTSMDKTRLSALFMDKGSNIQEAESFFF